MIYASLESHRGVTTLLSYSSGYAPCGVNDYNRHLMGTLPPGLLGTTVCYPTRRVPRHQVRALVEMRREYARLADRSTAYDAVLLHFASKYWNGGRPLENMLPLFLGRIRRPIVAVLHEWPTLTGVEHHQGARAIRLGKRLLTNALLARDLGRTDYVEWNERRVFQHMSRIIVHTPEFQERLIQAGVPAARITFARFPLHPEAVPSLDEAAVRSRFHLEGKRALLLLGQPVARKGFPLAVEALRRLPPDVVLVLVCSERDDRERAAVDGLRSVARQHGVGERLFTTGYLDDGELASVMRVATLALAPFTSMSGSSSIANCVASGLPVAASSLPPMEDALAAGAGVVLFAPGEIDDLVRVVLGVLDDKAGLANMRAASGRYAAAHSFEQLGFLVRDLVVSLTSGAR